MLWGQDQTLERAFLRDGHDLTWVSREKVSVPSKEGRAHPEPHRPCGLSTPRLGLGSWETRNTILLSTSCPFRGPACPSP